MRSNNDQLRYVVEAQNKRLKFDGESGPLIKLQKAPGKTLD